MIIETLKEKTVSTNDAMAAKLAEMVRVKPLEWKKPIPNSESESGYSAGRSEYPIIQTENGWRVYCIPGDSGIEFPTKEAAKAAAQADFERRILSVLELTPAPEQRELSLAVQRIRDLEKHVSGQDAHIDALEARLAEALKALDEIAGEIPGTWDEKFQRVQQIARRVRKEGKVE